MEHQFIKDRDIILFSSQPWNSEIAFNFKDMAFELARYNRVLFIDRARDRNSILKRIFSSETRKKKKSETPQLIRGNLWILHPGTTMESGNWSPVYKLFDFFNRINNKRLATEIKQSIRYLKFDDCLMINDNDFFRGLYQKSLLPVRNYIFYLRDALTSQRYYRKYGPRCEMEMIQKADLVVANSAWLAEYAGQWNPNSINIGQGCNLDSFIKTGLPEPPDMRAIPKPIAGYCGALSSLRLDEELLIYIARSLPEISLVLVGPADNRFMESQLRTLPNVYFLGLKPPDQTASYIHQFNVCINPQLLNPLTIGNYPRKIDEYLASGKPVVATATAAMEMFRNFTELCTSKEDFVMAIRKLISQPEKSGDKSLTDGRDFALTHNWENSMGALGDALYFTEKK
jgi:glycosyltransferase involved in cell wall biosynthesis